MANPNWQKGMESPNQKGRPRVLDKDKKTNRTLRQDEFMSLVRKFRPHLSKAIRAATTILDDDSASESGKLRASALIISTYKDLISQVFDYRYDDEEAEEIQQNNAPIFSLRMIGKEEEDKAE